VATSRQILPRFLPGPVLARAARLWWRGALWYTLVGGIEWGPATVLGMRGEGMTAGLELQAGLEQRVKTFLLVNLFALFAGALAEAAIILGVLQDAAGRRVGPARMLAAASERYPRALAVNAVCTALAVGGFLLLPLLGLVFQSLTFVALPVALAEPALSVADVLRRTWDLARGRRLLLLFLVTLFWALDALTSLLFPGAIPGVPGWAMLTAQAVAASLVGGFLTVTTVAFYAALVAAPAPQGPRG
jgi:hypothetical protein